MNTNEKKNEAFRRLAEVRVNRVIDLLGSIGKLGNKANYDYSDNEKKQLLSAISKAYQDMKNCFNSNAKTKDDGFKFK